MARGWVTRVQGSSTRNFHMCLQKAQKKKTNDRWLGFGIFWMNVLLHTGQRVGRRGVPEASPMAAVYETVRRCAS